MADSRVPTSTAAQPTIVAHEVLERIRSGQYAVGEMLPGERNLAVELGVSRPVVREALRMLVMLDVIEVQVGRGNLVTSVWEGPSPFTEPSISDLRDIIDAREVIEVGALSLAAERATKGDAREITSLMKRLREAVERGGETDDIDYQLHYAIVRSAHSPVLTKIWTDLGQQIRRSVRISPNGRRMDAQLLELHLQLANGVARRATDDAIAAARIMYTDNRAFLNSSGLGPTDDQHAPS